MSWSRHQLDYTPAFFSDLLTSDDEARARNTARLVQEIQTWAEEADRSPQRELLAAHLPSVLRLSLQCPFADVRHQFAHMLGSLKIPVPRRLHSGPSLYMHQVKGLALPLADESKRESELYREMFFHDGRCSNMVQLMMFFPDYLECFVRTLHYMMRCDGPLPPSWRCYVAMMAASRYNCKYLMHLLQTQYRVYGGDAAWLEGIKRAPQRLQNLQELNCTLAHQPWRMHEGMIRALVRGADSWSMSELAQVAVILVTYHALCGFVSALGVAPEPDAEDGYTYLQDVPEAGPVLTATTPDCAWTDRTARALKSLTAAEDDEDFEDETPAERMVSFERAEVASEYMNLNLTDHDDSDLSARFTSPPKTSHWPLRSTDFNTKETPPFRIQDYSWQDHAYSQLNRFYGVAQLLDDEFSVAFGMTDNRLGESEKIDTTKFRQAIWNYIHRLHGIFHDDYDYQEVNQLLAIPVKSYIKKVACYASAVTVADFAAFGTGLRDSEKVHINILVMDAKKQAAMIFFLHAVMAYMNN